MAILSVEEQKNQHGERKNNITIDVDYDDPISWNINVSHPADDIQWSAGAKNHEDLFALYIEYMIDTRLKLLGLPKISEIIQEHYPEIKF